MNRNFMPTFKTKEELADLQLAGLKWTVRHAWEGVALLSQEADGGERHAGSDPKP